MSIGVSAKEVECSVCGQKLRTQGWCDHYKGEVYQVKDERGVISEKVCYYIIQGLMAREISFVLTPSDDEAQVVSPDLGEKGLKVWSAKPGTLSTVTEMATGKQMPLAEVLKGFSLSESLKTPKETILMPTKKAVSPAVTTTEEATEPITRVFESVQDILTAASEIAEAGESADEVLVTQIAEALETAGLSADHVYRIETSAIEGVPALPVALATKVVPVEEGESYTAPEQGVITVSEYVAEVEKYLEAAVTQVEASKEAIKTLTAEKADIQAKLDEMVQTTEAVLTAENKSLKEQLAEAKTRAHVMLATSVAVEMKRSNSPIANGLTLEALTDKLSQRTEASLTDTYSDLLAALSSAPPAQTNPTEKVTHPAHDNRQERSTGSSFTTSMNRIAELMAKQKQPLVADVVPGQSVHAVTESDPEPTLLRTHPDGTFTIEMVEKEVLDKKMDAYSL